MKKSNLIYLVTGIIIGAVISVPAASAAEDWYKAYKSGQNFYVDDEKVEMEAYAVHENNFVKLRDIGEIVGFNVYWDEATGTVQIETDKPYTGEAPKKSELDDNLEIRKEMIDLVNALRTEHGLYELNYDERLMNAAQERARICSETHNLSHDKEISNTLLLKYEYGNGGAGCNIGWSSYRDESAEAMVNQFVRSRGHYEAMLLEDVYDVGVGVYYGDGVYFILYLGNEAWY